MESDWDRYRDELRSMDPDDSTVFTADEVLGLAESRIKAELCPSKLNSCDLRGYMV